MAEIIIFAISALVGLMSVTVVNSHDSRSETQYNVDHSIETGFDQVNTEELIHAEVAAGIFGGASTGSAINFVKDMNCHFIPSYKATEPYCATSVLNAWEQDLITTANVKGLTNGNLTRQLVDVSAPNGVDLYADFLVTNLKPSAGSAVTQTLRIDLGSWIGLNAALTTNQADCLFCHGVIYGNVSQYGSIIGMGGSGTRYHGSLYGALDDTTLTTTSPLPYQITSDPVYYPTLTDQEDSDDAIADPLMPAPAGFPDPSNTNYSYWLGYARAIVPQYRGPSLPWNLPRQQLMLPKFNPDSALLISHGSIKGPTMLLFPYGTGNNAKCHGTTTEIDQLSMCNVIINARDGVPLTISGNVFIRGDVIIFGSVSGAGSIYSGRNIYIGDNLSYLNPPPVFDGSSGSNVILDQVATNGTAVAALMKGYDELKLFAANNIVIGDPYPEYENGAPGTGIVGTDFNYIFNSVLALQNNPARDPVSGYMLDASYVRSDGTICYVLPWGSSSNCVANPVVRKWRQYQFSDPVSDLVWWKDAWGIPYPAAFTENFYPQTPSDANGGLTPWLTQTEYINYTKNPAAWTYATTLDASGRRKRQKTLTFPPFTKTAIDDPFNYNLWQSGAQMVATMEGYAGVNLHSIMTVNHGTVAGVQGPPVPLDQRIANFLDTCVLQTWENATNRFQPGAAGGGACVFTYNSNTQLSLGQGPNCDDVSSDPMVPNPPSAACTTDPTDSGYPAYTYQNRVNSDFTVRYTAGLWTTSVEGSDLPRIDMITPYWDPAAVRPRNRISKIQAFLFANQYIFHALDTESDRQLRVSGGMVAQQVAGKFVNHFGSDRTYPLGFGFSSGTIELDLSASPSLILYQDARSQYDTELIGSDFGSTMFHH